MANTYGNAVAKLNYSHQAMIDMIMTNPAIKQGEIAKAFGYTEGWVSRVMASDAFAEALAEARKKHIDPIIAHTNEERLKGLVGQAADIVSEHLTTTKSPKVALQALDMAAKALGMGARSSTVAVTNQFVVAMPTIAPSVNEWTTKYGGGEEIDVTEG